jgi:HSP20 family molecular chaperone IbpA
LNMGTSVLSEATGLPALRLNDDIENIREMLEMLMSDHTPGKQNIKMKTSFGWEPPMDVFDTETEFVVVMDISGMNRNDIMVFTDGHILKISGVRKDIVPSGKKQFHALEIQVGPFQRLIGIPVPVLGESLSTEYANGILKLRLQKRTGDAPNPKVDE